MKKWQDYQNISIESTVNQLLFTMTLFPKELEINSIGKANFRNQALSTTVLLHKGQGPVCGKKYLL